MPDINRRASATWTGDFPKGRSVASVPSGALKDTPISASSRFGEEPGSNPEELIAAAHASCFSMQLSALLTFAGHPPAQVQTDATLTMRKTDSGFQIYKMHLETRAQVAGIDPAAFQTIATQAKEVCPVTGLLKPGLEVLTLNATLSA